MADFPLCPACRKEYEDPQDRRFHAEPIACPECGPQLTFRQGDTQLEGTEASLKAFLDVVAAGGIVAVKGVGGYHLLCDGRNEEAVRQLRQRKARPHKPLAILFPYTGDRGLAAIKQELRPTEGEARLLCSPIRPIVLCRKQPTSTLAESIAPDLSEIGAMLPYSPLHHLLSMTFDGPLVATSGNISGEPVITDAGEAESRLGRIADALMPFCTITARSGAPRMIRSIARLTGHYDPCAWGGATPLWNMSYPFA
jgi:hydrogenase maturation protein HypF